MSARNKTLHSDQPLVSILVPVYNREAFIEDCLNSALNQDYSNIEVVVCDNGSTDTTWEKCLKFEKINRNVRCFRSEINHGPVFNWQRCFDESVGKYIKFLFSDDLLRRDCITKMVDAFQSNAKCEIVFSAATIGTSEALGKLAYSSKTKSLSELEYISLLIINQAPVSPGAFLFERDSLVGGIMPNPPCLSERDFWRHGGGSDLYMILHPLNPSSKLTHLSEPLVFFRSHPESFTASALKPKVHDAYRSVLGNRLLITQSHKFMLRYLGAEYVKDIIRGRQHKGLRAFIREYTSDDSRDFSRLGAGLLFLCSVIGLLLSRPFVFLSALKKGVS